MSDIVEINDSMNEGMLRVIKTEDGDICLSVTNEHGRMMGVQFCTLRGGGRSPETLKALIALHEAIKKDKLNGDHY